MAIDPVCGMKVDENSAPAHTQFAGKKYSFCSEECRKKFEQNPEQYAQTAA
jgi:YHS domain-containing protein